MRNAFVNRQLQHFRVDHDETNVFRLRLVKHAEDHGVHPNRFTRTGCSRHQQVRHFRQIGYHRIAGNIFTQHDGQRRRVFTELRVIQHFTQINGLPFFVRQFQAYVWFTRNHFHHAHRDSRQRTRQVTRKVGNTRRFHTRRQIQFKTGDHRTWRVIHHISLDAEISQASFNQARHLFQREGINRLHFTRWLRQQIQ